MPFRESIPQGTYTGATITMASATCTYIDPNTKAVTQKTFSGPFTANVTFTNPVTVGSTPMSMAFDLNLANSVSMASGSMTFNPVFQASSGMQGAGSPMDFMKGMQNGAGNGMMGSYFAEGATVNIASNATFGIEQSNVDMSALPFTPVFDATHLYVGQSVMPVSSGAMMSGGMGGGGMMGGSMAGSINSSAVYLEQQGVTGMAGSAISPGSTSSFALTLPSDSAFTALTGATNVTVYQQSSTIVSGTSAISNGASIHAYGLLFQDAGKWKMVASRIGAN